MYNIVYNIIHYLYVKYDVHKCVYVYIDIYVCYMFGITIRYDGRALIRFCEAESIQRIRSS